MTTERPENSRGVWKQASRGDSQASARAEGRRFRRFLIVLLVGLILLSYGRSNPSDGNMAIGAGVLFLAAAASLLLRARGTRP
jgi:hypothetical protein